MNPSTEQNQKESSTKQKDGEGRTPDQPKDSSNKISDPEENSKSDKEKNEDTGKVRNDAKQNIEQNEMGRKENGTELGTKGMDTNEKLGSVSNKDQDKTERGKGSGSGTKETDGHSKDVEDGNKSMQRTDNETELNEQNKHVLESEQKLPVNTDVHVNEGKSTTADETLTQHKKELADEMASTSTKEDQAVKVKRKVLKTSSGLQLQPRELKKDEIKDMILRSDNKALSKAMKSRQVLVKPANPSNFVITSSDIGHQPPKRQPSINGNLVKGSNVKKLKSYGSSGTFDLSQSGRSTAQSSSGNLEMALSVRTMGSRSGANSDSSGMTVDSPFSQDAPQTSTVTSSKPSRDSEKGSNPGTRPTRIVVKPKQQNQNGNKLHSKKSTTSTGIGAGPDVSLPEKGPSQVCVVQ